MSALAHPIRLPSLVRRRRVHARPLFRDVHEMVDTLRWIEQRKEARCG
jgi:hypothetical protein